MSDPYSGQNPPSYGGSAPTPPSSVPPPPPPPSETAFGAQSPASFGAQYGGGGYYGMPTQPVSTLGNWSRILIGATAAAGTISNLAPESVAGQIFGIVNLGVLIGGGVVTIIWLYRMAENVQALGRHISFGPLWAIFGWLILPFIWIIPALQINELWKASDPSPNWTDSAANWKVWAWFAMGPVSLIVAISTGITTFSALASEDTEAEITRALDQGITTGTIINAIVTVAAAGLFIWMSTELTNRHEALRATVNR